MTPPTVAKGVQGWSTTDFGGKTGRVVGGGFGLVVVVVVVVGAAVVVVGGKVVDVDEDVVVGGEVGEAGKVVVGSVK